MFRVLNVMAWEKASMRIAYGVVDVMAQAR